MVTSDWPPVLIIHSRNDGVVAPEHSDRLHAALDAAGVENQLVSYDREETDHGIWVPGTNPPVFYDFLEGEINAFLARHLALENEDADG